MARVKKTTSLAKRGSNSGTSLVKWEDKLAELAEEVGASEKPHSLGNFLSLRGGQMSYRGNPIANNELDVVIVGSVFENILFGEKFDPDNPANPECYAVGISEDELSPHADVQNPRSEKCEGCPNNDWGTAETGRGKACRNTRRLALISVDSLGNISEAPVAYLRPPVTSVEAWTSYVTQLRTVKKIPYFAAITKIKVVPDSRTQFKVSFLFSGVLNQNQVMEILDRRVSLTKEMMFGYPKNVESDRKVSGRGRGGVSKQTRRKTKF